MTNGTTLALRKIYIDVDERYPDYSWTAINEHSSEMEKTHAVEADPESLRRWKRIEDAYDEMQRELSELMSRE